MKKQLTILLFIMVFCLVNGNVNLSLFPVLSLNNYPDVDSSYKPTFFDLKRASSFPALGTAGLTLDLENMNIITRLELRQDFSAFLMGRDWSNLPISIDSYAPFADNNFPRVGYIQYDKDNTLVSAGRRKLKWGPGTYSMSLSSEAPYYDHIWFSQGMKTDYGKLWYSFLALSADRTVYDAPKTLLGHKVGLKTDSFNFSIGEQNLIYGVYPDLQDLGPFIVFHNNHQIYSNVMLVASMEKLFKNDFRVYSEFVMDDFRLNTESSESNPNAMGGYIGLEYKILDDKLVDRAKIFDEDYSLEEGSFAFHEGLSIKYEHYHATTYLYNRNEDIGKWTNPIRQNVMWLDSWPIINTFFGFPYGPDTTLDLIGLNYTAERMKGEFTVEYLRKGNYDIDGEYSSPFSLDWVGPVEPIKDIFILSGKATYNFDKSSLLLLSADLVLTDTEKNYNLMIGFGKTFSF